MASSMTASGIPGGVGQDPTAEEVAQFAINAYNRTNKEKISLVRVLEQDINIVGVGVLQYILLLEVKNDDDGHHRRCHTKVWVSEVGTKMEVKEFFFVDRFNQKEIGGCTDAENDIGIEDLADAENDMGIEDLAKFAVDEYNNKENEKLELVRVIAADLTTIGEIFVTLYRLLLEVKDDDGLKRIVVLVYDKPDGVKEMVESYIVELNQEIIGEWTDAGNDVGIEDLAKFAVDEYNKKEGTTLEFTKLKNAQKQLVDGILYRLTLEAIDDGHKKLYQAKVTVISWEEVKELEDFKPLLLNDED